MSGDLRAAEYVLGLLDATAREDVARASESDGALKAEIEWWEAKLAPAAGGVDAGEHAPAAMLDRIMARIDASPEQEAASLPGTITLRAHEGEWKTHSFFGHGVERKMLWDDVASGRQAYLVRMAPGGELTSHLHPADEECYVISGDLNIGAFSLKAGDFHLAKRGVAHPTVTSKTGAVFLISTQTY